MQIYNRRLCDYINSLAQCGFVVERVIEETAGVDSRPEKAVQSHYYSPTKAGHFPLTLIIKSQKR